MSGNGRYKLVGHEPIPCPDLMEWAEWFEKAERRVAKDEIGPRTVSTVFLALDHSFRGGRPLLFETMIFGPEDDEYQERCSTWAEAEAMHARAVAVAKQREKQDEAA